MNAHLQNDLQKDDLPQRRSRAVKTAWILGVVAATIFTVFILTGVIGR
jgi:hypothetical protein